MTANKAEVSASVGGWKSFWQLIKMSNPPKWLFIIAILLSLVETAAGLVVPLLTKSLVDQMAASALEASLIVFFAAAFILQTISSGFSYYFMTYMGEKIVASLRQRLWRHVLTLPIPYFDQHESGETMSRITQDTNIVKALITQHLVTFITGLISIIGAIIILLVIDWKMTLIMLISVPISVLIILPLGQKIYKISLSTQDEMAHFSGNLGRVLADIRLVKAYHAEKTEIERGEKGITHLFQFGLKEAKIQAIVSPFMTLIMMLVLVILIGYGGVKVAAGTLSAGALVAIIIYLFQIIVPFTQMASFFTAYQKALGATERIQEMLELNSEASGLAVPENSSTQNISFHQLVFSYGDKPVIQNINLQVPSGKTTAFVGPSGSGKTTLFALLERFYSPSDGAIFLGDQNIDEFDLHNWRSQIAYVSQESPLMSGSIRDNICYGLDRPVSDDELLQAAKVANAAEFIENLPDQYETEVGERGIKLSGGQRQRIAIARAVIRDPKILLLDEATSNLDSASEQLVQEALQQLMKNRTTLVIAHRLSTVFDADQIVVLEKGSITGIGTHMELFETHELYKKLAKQQLKTEA
ncbi:MAG: ABC transporter ATP-binding protein [Cytobacillus gottheilii]|uniref:ABC transporter ATP-binding protein n=1 Tax=Cytobacillus gottheilii TaxID=859144 RepID=UPI0008377CD7|nr:ABC transporter ATP-binding protein [Cytobacillus gottheilii]